MKNPLLLPALTVLAASSLAREVPVEDRRPSAGANGTSIAVWDPAKSDGKKAILEPEKTFVPMTVVEFRSSYVFESDFERGRDASGDAWYNSAYVAQRFALPWTFGGQKDAGWYFRLGAEYGRYDFDNAGGLPLPETLQNANAVLAVEYLVSGEVAMLFETAPGFYFENDLDGESFDAPTRAAAAFGLSSRVFLVAGVAYRGQWEKYPVLPALGLVWLINDQWRLRLLAPAPRLTYQPSENLRLWIGGEWSGGAYRTDDDRPGNLRNAALSYSEYKVGGGFTLGNPDRAALDFAAGYAFQRKFDYHRAEEGYKTDEGAPYVRIGFSGGF